MHAGALDDRSKGPPPCSVAIESLADLRRHYRARHGKFRQHWYPVSRLSPELRAELDAHADVLRAQERRDVRTLLAAYKDLLEAGVPNGEAITRAAEECGVERATLANLLKGYGSDGQSRAGKLPRGMTLYP